MGQADLLITDYLEHYSLRFDPFEAGASHGFWGGAGRQNVLDQALHCAEFTPAALVVTGIPGVGRSAVAARLVEMELSAGIGDALFIDVAQASSPLQCFVRIAESLELDVELGVTAGEVIAQLRSALQDLGGRPILVVLDDADLLDDSSLSGLLSLLQGVSDVGRLRLAFVGSPALIERLDSFGMLDVMLQDWQLQPLCNDECSDFLAWLLAEAGCQHDVFTDEKLAQVVLVSGGVPAKILPLAQEILIEQALVDQAGAITTTRAPIWHLAILSVLGGLLLMLFFYREADEVPQEPLKIASVVKPLEVRPVDADEDMGVAAPEVVTPVVVNKVADKQGPAAVDDVRSGAALADEARVLLQEALQAEREKVIVLGREAVQGLGDVSELVVSKAGLPESERHLLSLDKNHYVLQVLAASSRQSVDGFVRKQKNQTRLHVFETFRNGKPWFTVVEGDYPSQAEARRALAELPQNQQKAGAWPRSVSDVQLKIANFRGI